MSNERITEKVSSRCDKRQQEERVGENLGWGGREGGERLTAKSVGTYLSWNMGVEQPWLPGSKVNACIGDCWFSPRINSPPVVPPPFPLSPLPPSPPPPPLAVLGTPQTGLRSAAASSLTPGTGPKCDTPRIVCNVRKLQNNSPWTFYR